MKTDKETFDYFTFQCIDQIRKSTHHYRQIADYYWSLLKSKQLFSLGLN